MSDEAANDGRRGALQDGQDDVSIMRRRRASRAEAARQAQVRGQDPVQAVQVPELWPLARHVTPNLGLARPVETAPKRRWETESMMTWVAIGIWGGYLFWFAWLLWMLWPAGMQK